MAVQPAESDFLHKFPPEIRTQIFSQCLVRSSDEKDAWARVPALLIAVRPDATVYEEALELFYKLNGFTLNSKTVFTFESLKAHHIKWIKRLVLRIP